MGKGDKRSFKGKVFKGSFGKTRPRHLRRRPRAQAPLPRKRRRSSLA
jgi:ribosomal small subunit protein bTHX